VSGLLGKRCFAVQMMPGPEIGDAAVGSFRPFLSLSLKRIRHGREFRSASLFHDDGFVTLDLHSHLRRLSTARLGWGACRW
jgi:hypothetical protein